MNESDLQKEAEKLAKKLFKLAKGDKYTCTALGGYFMVPWLKDFSTLTNNEIRADAIGDFFRGHVESELKSAGVDIIPAKEFEERYY